MNEIILESILKVKTKDIQDHFKVLNSFKQQENKISETLESDSWFKLLLKDFVVEKKSSYISIDYGHYEVKSGYIIDVEKCIKKFFELNKIDELINFEELIKTAEVDGKSIFNKYIDWKNSLDDIFTDSVFKEVAPSEKIEEFEENLFIQKLLRNLIQSIENKINKLQNNSSNTDLNESIETLKKECSSFVNNNLQKYLDFVDAINFFNKLIASDDSEFLSNITKEKIQEKMNKLYESLNEILNLDDRFSYCY